MASIATSIGVLHETSLHAQLKQRLRQPGDELETVVDGYQVDVRRGDLLIEVQTRGFSGLKTKLARLLERYRVLVVHPVPVNKWILRMTADGRRELGRRRSPKHGRLEDVFEELVSIPELAVHPRFSLKVMLTEEEEIRLNDGRGSWRRKGWSIHDRRLLRVLESHVFTAVEDFAALLPQGLPRPFTTADLAAHSGQSVHRARQMAYCLRRMGALETAGKRGNAILYLPRDIPPAAKE